MVRGRLIALEGLDGSGTTTLARALEDRLGRRGIDVHRTAEPSIGPLGVLLRRVLRGDFTLPEHALALAFAADRLDHYQREIEPRLARGVVVVTDRYVVSSLAYQGLMSPPDWVASMNRFAPAADLTLFVRVAPSTAARRRAHRDEPAELFDANETQRRLAAAYETALAAPNLGTVVVLDGEAAADQVADNAEAAILGLGIEPTAR